PPELRRPGGALALSAQHLEIRDFQEMEAADVQITTCSFLDPHWALAARHAKVTRKELPPRQVGEHQSVVDHSYRISLSKPRFQAGGRTLLPLPPLTWDTRWTRSVPLKEISYSSSSRFGNRFTTVWNGDLLLPRALKPYVDLDLRLETLSNRGVGYGADVEYGENPRRWSKEPPKLFDVYGVGTFYGINDRQSEDNNGFPIEHSQRNRTRWMQRIRLPWKTYIDLEYAAQSDANFLNEYFRSEVETEQTPESYIYIRQPLTEQTTATLLLRKRMDTFRTVVERLPELTYQVVEQQVGTSGLFFDAIARGSYLRYLPSSDLAEETERNTRGDIRSAIAYPFGRSSIMKIRPFFETRFTAYEEDQVRGNSIERTTLATGARAEWQFSRAFAARSEFLEIDGLRHVINPGVSYRVVWANNVDPDELFRFDGTEDVDRFEILTLSLRNLVYARRPGAGPSARDSRERPRAGTPASKRTEEKPARVTKILEFDVEIDYFPDATRDNLSNNWSNFRGELLLWPYPALTTYTDFEYDVENGGIFQEFNAGMSYRFREGSTFGINNRYRNHQVHSLVGSATWMASPKYQLGTVYEYDLREHKTVSQEYLVVRNFHRWAVILSYRVTQGVDSDSEFTVNFGPRELWESIKALGQ
ncbi:MAG: hypothetical protein V3T77_00235, partial [Planctomycetota bacterium]